MVSRQRRRHPARSSASLALPPQVVQLQEVPRLPSSIFSLRSLLSKICASEQEPLDPQSIHRNRYSASTRARRTREKALVVLIVTACFLWLIHDSMLPVYSAYSVGAFHLVLVVAAGQVMVLDSNVSSSVFPSRCKSKY